MVQLQTIDFKTNIAKKEDLVRQVLQTVDNKGIILQTCNRLEIYSGEGFIPEDIISHLFQVVCGLKSQFVGECAIQNQVKQAYLDASKNQVLNKSLHKLFQTALCVGKRIRTQTGISQGAMSHSQAAVDILLKTNQLLENKNITIIGVNNLNETIIKFLIKKGVETFLIGNRTFDKASEFAGKYNCKAFKFSELYETLERTDILISATSAPHEIVRFDKFPKHKEMTIIDLAFPRDIDYRIGQLENIQLFNIDDIAKMINQNLDLRKAKINNAEKIISYETRLFYENQDSKPKQQVSTIAG